jgi:hypothetical protein
MHLYTVYMEYSECLPTRLNPLAERTSFSFPLFHRILSYYAEGCTASWMRDRIHVCNKVLRQVSGQGLDVVSEHGVEAHPPYQLVRFGANRPQ